MVPKIVLLSGKGQYVEFIYNGLVDTCPVDRIFLEDAPDSAQLEIRRMKKIGRTGVVGQRLFYKYIIQKLKKTSKERVREIIRQHRLNPTKIPGEKITAVRSVNDRATIESIRQCNPDLVIVNNTRVLSKNFLQSVRCPVVNIHGGITPGYRGFAGAYWALVNGEPQKCGSTLHLIDEGIDTGPVLYQETFTVSLEDNYLTYPFLGLVKEISMLKKVIADVASGNLKPLAATGTSQYWYEPTIWQYWYNAILKKVK